MSAKGYKKHKCKLCGALQSTAGAWCMKCIEAFIVNKKGTN